MRASAGFGTDFGISAHAILTSMHAAEGRSTASRRGLPPVTGVEA